MQRTKSLSLLAVFTASVVACTGGSQEENEVFVADDGIDLGDTDGADDSGSADGTGSGGTDPGPGNADGIAPSDCQHEQFDLRAEPPAVMLVLDKSSSMSDQQWLHRGEYVTRWASLVGVVSDLVNSYDSTIAFGATLFPSVEAGHWSEGFDSACQVASAPDVGVQLDAEGPILNAMPGPDIAVQGATPTREGLRIAAEHLTMLDAQQRAIVLVTDGLANCTGPDEDELFLYDQQLPAQVLSNYEALGISTYVVGIDIRDEDIDYAQANAHEALDEVARAGGVPRAGETAYYAANDEQDLFEAMESIAASIGCTVSMGVTVPEDAIFEVRVGGELVPEINDCATEDGWRFIDPIERSTIELCGSSCDTLSVEGRLETQSCGPDSLPPEP